MVYSNFWYSFLVVFVLLMSAAQAADKSSFTLKDRQGRITQSVQVQGNRLVFRDNRGRYQGQATFNGRTVTLTDRQGRRK